ncbi:hypothetical protein PILCRDRAFT_812127 [Piloderma croceum F 1598]|uniref:Pantoate--beta-alanine ligase n=1 Tax=Piloderma croceum (strain F 1598) TaxID=765440 RepID=A0A0C3GFD0_PILCF|nr:hypothetical protein PILCRDRAFT_812127 [Piloderma croceum F 1598]
MSALTLPPSQIPIFSTVSSFRAWRSRAFEESKSVGFVATMGALHDGHLSLVKRSLQENDLTVLSIFVNPAQFAPNEDLATYPRTLPRDLELLTAQSVSVPHITTTETSPFLRMPSAVFLPSVSEMYPSGISQDRDSQRGTFIEVKGYGDEMEGKSRPGFFRGVATVVTKLFNVIQPTNTYFGQKDIQQALLLRRLTRDLLLSHPTPSSLHIIPTTRDPTSGLALSSRNAYLTPDERAVAGGTLYEALRTGEQAWMNGETKEECVRKARGVVENVSGGKEARDKSVNVSLDYIEMNDADSFEVIGDGEVVGTRHEGREREGVILSGAIWVGKTRLIDNIVLGDMGKILG